MSRNEWGGHWLTETDCGLMFALDDDDYTLALKCVNALAGIADPAAAIDGARIALKLILAGSDSVKNVRRGDPPHRVIPFQVTVQDVLQARAARDMLTPEESNAE